jgi:hypothetical protein
MIDEVELEGFGLDSGGMETEDPMRRNWKPTLPVCAHVAAKLVEAGTNVGDRARGIVGRRLDQHRHPVGRVPFVEDLFVVGAALPEARLIAASTLSLGILMARAF